MLTTFFLNLISTDLIDIFISVDQWQDPYDDLFKGHGVKCISLESVDKDKCDIFEYKTEARRSWMTK